MQALQLLEHALDLFYWHMYAQCLTPTLQQRLGRVVREELLQEVSVQEPDCTLVGIAPPTPPYRRPPPTRRRQRN